MHIIRATLFSQLKRKSRRDGIIIAITNSERANPEGMTLL